MKSKIVSESVKGRDVFISRQKRKRKEGVVGGGVWVNIQELKCACEVNSWHILDIMICFQSAFFISNEVGNLLVIL